MMNTTSPAEARRDIPNWTLGLMGLGWLVATIGLLGDYPLICAIGAILVAVGAILGYMSQGRTPGMGGLSAPALHRDLAKTHCGSCGAPMRSNMAFCPVCGAPQTKT